MLDRSGFPRRTALASIGFSFALAAAVSASPVRPPFAGMPLAQGRALVPDASGSSVFGGRMAPKQPDTLEINAFLVEFAKEAVNGRPDDNPVTTGDGTFGSDSSTKTFLEPWRARRDSTRAHFLRVFEGVSEYWRTASGGKLEVVFRVFPETGANKTYALPLRMGQYNPIDKPENKTQAWFDTTRWTYNMEMVAGAVRKAATDPSGPFSIPKPTASNRHRSYLMIHAGADRMTDGGNQGASGENTKADLWTFTVGATDYHFLSDTTRLRDSSLRKDTLGVLVGNAANDTIKELLVTSETASQDKLNWGIRGTVTNLVGRALGLPDLWDTYRGLSVMGRYCVMDQAGAIAGRNSLPPLPSAWPRLFMGWATPVLAKPSGPNKYRLPAVRPGHDTVLVVPVNDGEYLLVENRQRTELDGNISIKLGSLAGTDSIVHRIKPDTLDSLLADTLRMKGYVLGASPDASLPGSGLLVWHVNEWLLKGLMRYGSPNAYMGDTLSDRYKAITLVQASGKQTLGRIFTGIAGQSADAGSGSDILPHAQRHGGKTDTITAIGPEGYASTGSLMGGRTLVTLRAPWPTFAQAQFGKTSLEGDTVWTPGAAAIEVSLDWGALLRASDSFPRRTTPTWGEQAILPGPTSLPKSVWLIDTAGRASLLDSIGAHWFAAKDTQKLVSLWDSTPTAFQNRTQLDTIDILQAKIGAAMGQPIQSATISDTLAVRDRIGTLHLKWPLDNAFLPANRDSARFADTAFALKASAGPVLASGRLWVGDSSGRIVSVSARATGNVISTGLSRIQSICATTRQGKPMLATVDTTGAAALIDPTNGTSAILKSSALLAAKGEMFQILSTDFDRDGVADLAVIGSFGNAVVWSGATNVPFDGWPKNFPRGSGGIGESGTAALADLDGDGRPELVFAGTDRLYAVDMSGAPLPGWPARIVLTESVGQSTASRRYPSGILGATPLIADLDGDASPEVVVGNSNGQISAWSASGRMFGGAVLSRTAGAGIAPTYQQASWPLSAGGQTLDTNRAPYLPLAFVTRKADRLLALSSLSNLYGFLVSGGKATWPLALGDGGRSGFLADSSLGPVLARKTGISDFHLFPSPVRKGSATFRYVLGQDAASAELTVYDQTGFQILSQSSLPTTAGRRDHALRNLSWGTGVYAARLVVKWSVGGSDEAWIRFGVVR